MTTKLGLAAEPGSRRSLEPAMTREAFRRLLAIEQQGDDRRLSAATAFLMFLFGVGCGSAWTLLAAWLF